uniref:Uncharacterized protein n=1 Tax=Chenopodium quinoa TaxID=63459 RepID=A0A803N598_CHEQI
MHPKEAARAASCVKMKDKKRALCPPGSMSAYLEFRKRQKENNEVIVNGNQSLNHSSVARMHNDDDALNEYDDALNENDDNEQLIENDYDDALIENDDGVGNEFEGDQELEWEVLPQFRREETEKASKSKRHRGPTMLPKVHARTREERPTIVLNLFGLPVGPTKEIVQEFKLFLGTVARDSEHAPLNYINFTSLPTLQQIWDYVLKQQDPNKQEPSQAKVYKKSRKRTAGRTYLTKNEKAEQNIAKMDALESSNHEYGSNSKDPYSEVIPNPKRKSRLRLHGKGVRMKDLNKKDKKSNFIFREEFIASMQEQIVQKLVPGLTTAVLTQLHEANPGINLVIPDFVMSSAPNNASSAPRRFIHQNG